MSCETKAELRNNWPANRESHINRTYGITKQEYIEMHLEH